MGMISRKHRFHGHNSLRYVYQHGHTARGPLTSLKFAENTRRSDYRLAVVVSKKTCKSAVKRNRIRRRLYEQVRLIQDSLNKPYDLVITVFNDQIASMPADELQKLVHSQLSLAKILQSTTDNSTPPHVKIEPRRS